MTVAAFVLGVIGTVFAAASLTWQVVSFSLQGARPKLEPVVGILTEGNLVTNDATRDVREVLRHNATQFPLGPLVIGVKVINAGRAPFHVAGWEILAEPSATALMPVDNPVAGPKLPYNIPARGEAIFVTELIRAQAMAATTEEIEGTPQRICSRCRAAVANTGPSP